jgi:hypothetical protein
VIPHPGRRYVVQVLPPDADNPTVKQPVLVTTNEARPSIVKAQKAVAAPSSRIVSWRRDQQPGKQFTTASETCEDARLGDALALRFAEREGYYVVLGLANLISVLAPNRIALGRGLMKSSSLFLNTPATSFARPARSFL